jgi:hypothetical protein
MGIQCVRSGVVGLILVVSTFTSSSRAQSQSQSQPSTQGFSLGARLGYMLPFGSAVGGGRGLLENSDTAQSKFISGGFPIIIEGGYRVTPAILAGIYMQYAFASFGGTCASSCSAHVIRFGLQGHYHVSPLEKFDPWFGLGFGYETAGVSASGGNATYSSSVGGFEFLNLQGGLDFKATPALRLGPMATLSFAQYSTGSFEITDGTRATSASQGIDSKAIHGWLTVGVRGQFDL